MRMDPKEALHRKVLVFSFSFFGLKINKYQEETQWPFVGEICLRKAPQQ